MPLKTVDLYFLAMDSPDFPGLPLDPETPGQRIDWNTPIASPLLWGVVGAPAAFDEDDRPLTQSEVWEQWEREQTLQTREQRDAELAKATARLIAMEAAAALAPQITDDELTAILEEIEQCQRH